MDSIEELKITRESAVKELNNIDNMLVEIRTAIAAGTDKMYLYQLIDSRRKHIKDLIK